MNINEGLLADLTGMGLKSASVSSSTLANSFNSIETTLSQYERQELIRTLTGQIESRQGLIETYDTVRTMDVVQTTLDVITDDAFYTNEGKIFTVYYDDGEKGDSHTKTKINNWIKDLLNDCALEALIKNLMDDLLLYGEYPVRICVAPEVGVIEIKDDMDPATTVGIYEVDEPAFFLEKSSRGYRIRDPREVIHFHLYPRKVPVKIQDSTYRNRKLPEHIRMGRSVIYPALSKIKQLRLIELSAMITDLKRAMAPVLVSVAVPPNAQPEDVTETVKKYEQHLQETFRGLDNIDNPSLADLFSVISNIRVIPNFTDGKGAVQTLDLLGSPQDTDSRIDRVRLAIAIAIGIPPYYITAGTGDTGQSKMEMLKLHSRYSRMLSSIQNSVADGIRRIIMLHIINKNVFIKETDIKIVFKKVISVENLDRMEYAVAAAQTLRDIAGVIGDVLSNDEIRATVNSEAFVNMFNSLCKPLWEEPLLRLLTDDEIAAETGGGTEGGGESPSSGGPSGGSTGDIGTLSTEEDPYAAAVKDAEGGGTEGGETTGAEEAPSGGSKSQTGGGAGSPAGTPVAAEAPLYGGSV